MGRRFLTLVGLYVSGVIVGLLYSKKNSLEIKAEMGEASKSGKNSFRVLLHNFIEVHKNFLKELEEKFLTEEDRKLLHAKMESLGSWIRDYKLEAQKVFRKYKSLQESYSKEGLKRLEKFYSKKLQEVDGLKERVLKEIKEIQGKLLQYYNSLRSRPKN